MKKNILFILLFIFLLHSQNEIYGGVIQGERTLKLNLAVNSLSDSLSFPYKEGKIIYERIVEIPETSKDILFQGAKIWFVETFKDSRAVIKSEDKEAGEILGTGRSRFFYGRTGGFPGEKNYVFNIRVTIKDNKYRIQIYDIIEYPFSILIGEYERSLESFDSVVKPSSKKDMYISTTNRHFYSLIDDFKTSLAKTKKDDF
jgi:hypothetical protein